MFLVTLGASMFGNMLIGKEVICAGKGIVRAGKGVVRLGRGYNNMDHIDKKFSSAPFCKQYQDY